MKKNNLYVFILHLALILVSVIFAAAFFQNFFLGGSLLSILLWIPYIFVGTRLELQTTILKNLLSVSSVGLIGSLLLLINVTIGPIESKLGGIYVLYVYPQFSIMLMIPENVREYIRSPIVMVFFNFIPTLLAWLGLQIKVKRNLSLPK